jgi:hypothetical protein
MKQTQRYADTLERPVRGDVYRNLQKDCLSVVDRRTDSDTYGEVIAYMQACTITDAEVCVYENKRQQSIEEDCKNVHAFFRGTVGTYDPKALESYVPISVSYKRNREGVFYTDNLKQVLEADVINISRKHGIYAGGVTTE